MQGNIVPWIKTDEPWVLLSGNFFPLEETVNVYYDYGSLGCDADRHKGFVRNTPALSMDTRDTASYKTVMLADTAVWTSAVSRSVTHSTERTWRNQSNLSRARTTRWGLKFNLVMAVEVDKFSRESHVWKHWKRCQVRHESLKPMKPKI